MAYRKKARKVMRRGDSGYKVPFWDTGSEYVIIESGTLWVNLQFGKRLNMRTGEIV